MEAHQKKNNKYNFVEQFQRPEIPCPRSLRSFGNQTAVNSLLTAAFAEQVRRRETNRRKTFLHTLKRVGEPVGCLVLV